jgi:hypothetical protein
VIVIASNKFRFETISRGAGATFRAGVTSTLMLLLFRLEAIGHLSICVTNCFKRQKAPAQVPRSGVHPIRHIVVRPILPFSAWIDFGSSPTPAKNWFQVNELSLGDQKDLNFRPHLTFLLFPSLHCNQRPEKEMRSILLHVRTRMWQVCVVR